jgi:hypothetical protein
LWPPPRGWFGGFRAMSWDEYWWRHEKLRAAYHEAGHAFWVWRTGGAVVSADICFWSGGRCGQTLFTHPGLDPLLPWADPVVLDYVHTSLAGVCAQFVGTRYREGWDVDFAGRPDVTKAMAHVVARGWEGANGKPWTQWDLYDFFVHFSGGDDGPRLAVHQSGVWACIEAVAKALLAKTPLDGREAVQIILDAWGDEPLPAKARPVEEHGEKEERKEDKENDS